MPTLTAQDALHIVRPRARAKHGRSYPGSKAMFEEASELWNDEFAAWKALSNAGLNHAADCAWARRAAAESLTLILVTAL